MTGIPWYRSWPESWRIDAAYVSDTMPKLLMHSYDYNTITNWPNHDLILLEWDIAIDLHDRTVFEAFANASRNEISVAAYRLSNHEWVHSYYDDTNQLQRVNYGRSFCDHFGLGIVYLPIEIVRAWKATKPDRWTDGTMSLWHHQNGYPQVAIDWYPRVAHLHE
jgi:hypothetical protein